MAYNYKPLNQQDNNQTIPALSDKKTKPMEEMTTREALEAAWDKQFPYGGYVTYKCGPLGEFTFYEPELNKPKEEKQTGAPLPQASTLMRRGEQLASAGLNGLSVGNIDEIEGGINAVGYGIANLGIRGLKKIASALPGEHNSRYNLILNMLPKDKRDQIRNGLNRFRNFSDSLRTPTEDAWTAMKRGYVEARDHRRQVLEQGRQEIPMAMNAMEMVGSVASPINKIMPNNPAAPLAQRTINNTRRAGVIGTIYGAGETTENTPQEYAQNIGLNVGTNIFGNLGTNRLMGRGGDDFTRTVYENGLANLAKETYNQASSFIPGWGNSNTENRIDDEEFKRRLR